MKKIDIQKQVSKAVRKPVHAARKRARKAVSPLVAMFYAFLGYVLFNYFSKQRTTPSDAI